MWNSEDPFGLVPELVHVRELYQALDRSTRGRKRPDPTVLRRSPQLLSGIHSASHLNSFGQAVYKQQSTVRVNYVDNNPWLIFRFLYRKRGVVLVTKNVLLLNRAVP